MTARRFILPALGAGLLAFPLGAQAIAPPVVDARWAPFVGCWQPPMPIDGPRLVCLVPTATPATVELLTVVADSIVDREALDASGAPRSIQRDGCSGMQTTIFATRQRAFLTRARVTCGALPEFSTSSIVSITASGLISRVEGITTSSYGAVRTTAYRSPDDTVVAPASILRRLATADVSGPRREPRVVLQPADVIEVAAIVDAPVVEAWLADRGESMPVSVHDLKAMRKADVPRGAIDMIIAIADTATFRIAKAPRQVSGPAGGGPWYGSASGRSLLAAHGVADSWNAMGYGWNGSVRNWRTGMLNDGWIVGQQPLVISPVPQAPSRSSGRVLNGQGYSQGVGTSVGTSVPHANGSVGSSGASSGGSGDGGRTAKARP